MSHSISNDDVELMLGALRAEPALDEGGLGINEEFAAELELFCAGAEALARALAFGFGQAEVGRRKYAAVFDFGRKKILKALSQDPDGTLRSIAGALRKREDDHGA